MKTNNVTLGLKPETVVWVDGILDGSIPHDERDGDTRNPYRAYQAFRTVSRERCQSARCRGWNPLHPQ